ncbi:MAG TPA: hypothetical protein VGO52_01860 [Hyphomonadaceae bacterium]|jgi:hypothetical protein|nr:hypothetical protein [Hyphomonadaceae bacterium]
MSVELSNDGTIDLSGLCPLEDAEELLRLILGNPGSPVDWSDCGEAHTAVIQVLVAARPVLRGSPAGSFLRTWIEPLMKGEDIARP